MGWTNPFQVPADLKHCSNVKNYTALTFVLTVSRRFLRTLDPSNKRVSSPPDFGIIQPVWDAFLFDKTLFMHFFSAVDAPEKLFPNREFCIFHYISFRQSGDFEVRGKRKEKSFCAYTRPENLEKRLWKMQKLTKRCWCIRETNDPVVTESGMLA